MKLRCLDLFSGIGGMSLALSDYCQTVAYCEIDKYAQSVLLARMQSGDLDNAPIWPDVTTLRAKDLPPIDIITGGFPCQDISVAGRGAGLEGKRSGLFFEIMRLAKETKSPFLFLENVPAIRTRGLDTVVSELAAAGYDCRWGTLSAYDVGAPHRRTRWFLLAHLSDADGIGLRDRWQRSPQRQTEADHQPWDDGSKEPLANTHDAEWREGLPPGCSLAGGNALYDERAEDPNRSPARCRAMGNADSAGLEERLIPEQGSDEIVPPSGASWWAVEPDVGRVAHGISKRVDRIRCLGNSVVPAQAKEAFERLSGLKS